MRPKAWPQAMLYVVLDTQVQDYAQLFETLKDTVRAGVHIVQLRDKFGCSRETLRFCRKAVQYLQRKVPFIVNDRVDLALAAQADGVHLGQDDLPLADARKMMGRRAVIGVSCQTLAQARKAERDGADYIGFGSVFRTLTKPERVPMALPVLDRVVGELSIPVFAIGGIGLQNLDWLTCRGIRRVAVTRAVCLSADVYRTTRSVLCRLGC